MRRAAWLVLASLAVISTLLPIGTAQAVAAVPDVATVENQTMQYDESRGGVATAWAVQGQTLHFTVDYTGSYPGTYQTKVFCVDTAAQETTTVVPDEAPNGIVSYTATTPDVETGCSIMVVKLAPTGSENGRYVDVKLVSPDLTLAGFTNPSGAAFYPLVPDHPDYWTASFGATQPSHATMTVRTQSGRAIYSLGKASVRTPGDDSRSFVFSFAWRGRNSAGTLVPVGTYYVTFDALSTIGSGTATIGPKTAIVKSGRRTVTKSVTLSGSSAYVLATTGGCLAKRQLSGAVWLNCSQNKSGSSAYASATWSFSLPATAKIVGYKVSVAPAGDDKPGYGSVSHTLTRPTSTRVHIRTKVTYKRSFFANSVTLTYSYLK